MAARNNPDGPDGSSLKPVSSLRAQFENMNKTTDQFSSNGPTPVRSVSPGPKPERLRDAGASSQEPQPTHRELKHKPKAFPPNILANVSASASAPSPALDNAYLRQGPPRLGPLPLSPRPLKVATGPPSLLVQPPHSPPKGISLNTPVGDGVRDPASFLNPDSIVKTASPVTPGRQFKIPSRPHTPTPEPRRSQSPRQIPSQPPSPPPPRRSAELKREREQRDAKPVPPPINRAEKPLIPSRTSYFGVDSPSAAEFKSRIADKHSPFSSPPSSNGSADGDLPPTLPTRPRPKVELPQRANTIHVGFEPPPLHPSIANKRRERERESTQEFEPPPRHHSVAYRRRDKDFETNGTPAAIPSKAIGGTAGGAARGPITPQATGDQGPPLPTRPKTFTEQQLAATHNGFSTMRPPPRPPKPGSSTDNLVSPTASISADPTSAGAGGQKRVVSTPTAQQHPPPPARTHGRSMTVDRTSSRVPSEFRTPPVPPSAASSAAPTLETAAVRAELTAAYPDASNTNRRPPYIKQGVHEIHMKYDGRIFDVCGELVCTSGHLTRVWSLLDGELLMSLAHGDNVKATSVAFKPGANADQEGARLWIGSNSGELMEVDIMTGSIVANKPTAHGRHEIIKIYRRYNELWSLDDGGTLNVWGPDDTATPSLAGGPDQSFRVPKGHTFSIVVGDELWHATGKEIRVFLPSTDGNSQFQVLLRALYQDQAGDVTSGTLLPSQPDKVFFGHGDGKVSIYSRNDYSCLSFLNVSSFKINTLAGVGEYIWAGYNSGRVCAYDITQSPWIVKKDWQAHGDPVVKLISDRSSFWKLERSQVVSLGADNTLRSWDGLLQEDWLEAEMQAKDAQYCEMERIKALIMTWNAGASTPHSLRYSGNDASFFQNLLRDSGSPEILVFGFQELVDLEDKTATAKRFLKVKKKEGSDQERMSHQYRDWRDYLVRSLDDFMPGELYHLLQTAHMVGLFTCIFVKADLRDRIRNLSAAEVKRGMGGLHGNKGAIVVRFMVDDTSLCFINCHLAAGQSQATSRHNDVSAILEAAILPVERDPNIRIDSYVGGGDGTMILDHELCLLNGDLNYRIDTMSRDTVVTAVKSGNLAKLLERDQLLVAKRRNPTFRLRAFEEMPITFAPTYKYDVGTDNYDTSEKRRSPAWCDRLLHRGPRGRITQLDYRRHEVRVSDHRPVSGRFRFQVKRIDPKKRAVAWMECQQRFEDNKARVAQEEKLYYLTHIIGYDEATSRSLIRERSSRKTHRSPSRNRDG